MKENFMNLLKNWIAIPSIYDTITEKTEAPFGKNVTQSLLWINDLALSDGFDSKVVDGYYTVIDYGQSEDYIGVFGHSDVVPVSYENWTTNPFELTLRDGNLYGRGVVDDKGPILCCYLALKRIKDANIKLNNKIRIFVGGNEETGFKCLKHYLKNEIQPKYGIVPDAKFPVLYGERGCTSLTINGTIDNPDIKVDCSSASNVISSTLYFKNLRISEDDLIFLSNRNLTLAFDNNSHSKLTGIGGHASKPHLANNPIPHFLECFKNSWANSIYRLVCSKVNNSFVDVFKATGKCGSLSIVPTILKISDSNFEITYDIRYPEIVDIDWLSQQTQTYIENNNLSVTFKFNNNKQANYIDPNSKLVTELMNIYSSLTGDIKSKPRITSGGTYASLLENTVIFGCESPFGKSSNVHKSDEFISLDYLLSCIDIYEEALIKLASL